MRYENSMNAIKYRGILCGKLHYKILCVLDRASL